jgi:prephenate dehydrogenase
VKVAILGAGLIGGSIGLAARARARVRVCGYDPDGEALAAALELGAIDERAPDLAGALAGAEVVFAAAPVDALAAVVGDALAVAGPDCVVSDVGSTKLALAAAREDPRFVGGHPLAGAESAGVTHAREDLFDGAVWYLTPAPCTDPALYARLRGLIERLGARPTEIDLDAHDRLMATVSHLPHVLANVLAPLAATAFEREGCPPANVPSLRDAIRVAGANTAIWTDIYLANKDALIEAIEQAGLMLEEVRAALARADGAALATWNENARVARTRLLAETGVLAEREMLAGGECRPASAESRTLAERGTLAATEISAPDACPPASATDASPADGAP